jgi:HK97 gp10 family phage protein
MAKNVIKGLDKVLKDLKAFGEEGKKEIAFVTEAVADEISADAKKLAPVNKNPKITGGSLRQGIFPYKVSDMTYRVQAREKYSAYMEFGTGGKVNVPTELKELAIQFKGKGVKQINLQPQPFLYPAFVKGRETYLKDLENLLEDLSKKV